MRLYPSKEQLKQSWEKYGLIVVGNIVFFALLYFISYRPNNDENRAAEFLSMAQAQETAGRYEAAMVLYEKVGSDYPGTDAAQTAKGRLPSVKKTLALPARPEPELVEPRLDLEDMLSRRPSVYIATFLARHYHDDPTHRAKIHDSINRYLSIAANQEGVDLGTLSREKEFQSDFFQSEFFTVKPRCVMEPDWIWDDFSVKNTNFFAWTNVNIKLTVDQAGRKETTEIRIPELGPGETVDLLEFRVSGSDGVVTCSGDITSTEGTSSWSQQI